MKKVNNSLSIILLGVLLCFLQSCENKKKSRQASDEATSSDTNEYYSAADFSKVLKFNTHVHFKVYDTTFLVQARKDNFKFITVNVNSAYSPPIEKQQKIALELIKAYPDRLGYATTFYVKNFNDPDWQKKTISYLKESFANGAHSVKIWKNVGLELKDSKGKFVMIDDSRFDPVLDFIEQNNATLIGHIGEPKNAWLPVDKMTVEGDRSYFSEHPEYHMYMHPEYPTHEQIMAARDHMLQKHPKLLFVGAHLGSLEWDTDELAKRLDKYPNMAVDMAERISHFQYQAVKDWGKVHDFFIKYQDRLIYATDQTVNGTVTADTLNSRAHQTWLRHWDFFTSDAKMQAPDVEAEFKGLKLPRSVVEKIYRTNAEKWFPGYTSLWKNNN